MINSLINSRTQEIFQILSREFEYYFEVEFGRLNINKRKHLKF